MVVTQTNRKRYRYNVHLQVAAVSRKRAANQLQSAAAWLRGGDEWDKPEPVRVAHLGGCKRSNGNVTVADHLAGRELKGRIEGEGAQYIQPPAVVCEIANGEVVGQVKESESAPKPSWKEAVRMILAYALIGAMGALAVLAVAELMGGARQ